MNLYSSYKHRVWYELFLIDAAVFSKSDLTLNGEGTLTVTAEQSITMDNVPHEEIIRSELKRCADEIVSVDLSMQTIRDIL